MASFSVSDRAAGATGSEEIVASNSCAKKGLCQVMDSRTMASVCLDLCHEFLHNNHDVRARLLNDTFLGDKIALARAHC